MSKISKLYLCGSFLGSWFCSTNLLVYSFTNYLHSLWVTECLTNLGEIPHHYWLNMTSLPVSFFSPSAIPLVCHTFCSHPTGLRNSVFFCLPSLCFSVWEASVVLSSSSEVLSSAVATQSLSNAIFTSVSVFLISSFFFYSSLEFPRPLTLSTCSCMLSTFPLNLLAY